MQVWGFEPTERFKDRRDAGRKLAEKLRAYASQQPIVLGLPRGGVPVAREVARALHAPLDVLVVRKIGVPWQPELGIGAVAEGNHVHISPDVLRQAGLSDDELKQATREKRDEVDERVRRFRGDRERPDLRDRTVIIVDDGIATGGTVKAAIQAVRAAQPKTVVLATPVVAHQTERDLVSEVDHLVSLASPRTMFAIGLWYEDFSQVSDEQVVNILKRAREDHAQPGAAPPAQPADSRSE
jgi:putative phosphoribosyl transferase